MFYSCEKSIAREYPVLCIEKFPSLNCPITLSDYNFEDYVSAPITFEELVIVMIKNK